ncbi:MAG: mechanosensitive ion channel [Candidatus Eremiobacteraeota bacterium]|nr:mechanosensitive ion channel [Candidatus Eremiobacteraeota bacterium]MBC5802230.1 mechanosensitive ion channel [Candidatus Eremiobacteraeota bacterium]MBC5821033.1 mechanosensitive ion channel [Candidatus Eremiobacteraeota bacterium]
MDEARRAIMQNFSSAGRYLPNVLAALAILLLGAIIGWLVARFIATLLTRLGFDHLGERTGLIDDLARVGVGLRPSRLVGRIAFWVIFAAAFVQAVNGLELAPISQTLGSFLTYLPHAVLAVVLVLAGIIVGDTVGRGAAGAMSRAGVLYHDVAGGVLRAAIIVLFGLMALQQLTVDSAFLFYVLLVLLGTVALGVAIAGGWGARAFAENLVAAHYIERHLDIGHFIRVKGRTGTIERLDAMSTIVRTSEDRTIIFPNGYLARSVVEAATRPFESDQGGIT